MEECNPVAVPMQPGVDVVPAGTLDKKLPYGQLIGGLLFLARVTRPDIAFAVGRLSQFNHSYDESHWTLAKRVLRYLKGTLGWGLEYKKEHSLTLQCMVPIVKIYTDADYASDKVERKCTTGVAVYLGDSLVHWISQKQQAVALSTTEAEYVARVAGVKEAVWFRRLCEELGVEWWEPTEIGVDNQSAIRLVQTLVTWQHREHPPFQGTRW